MTFKIRTDADDLYESAYREHLSRFPKRNHTDLWRYFYWDFFHDGQIRDIIFRDGADKLIIEISCPNIRRKTGKNDYEYINIDFLCTFSDLFYFKFIKGADSEDTDRSNSGRFTFLSSEINTLAEHIPAKKDDDFGEYMSMIIEVMPAYGSGDSSFIEFVFGGVSVEAIENTAFQLMLASPDFEVPIYNENE
ncbi:hypothetical protein [Desulforegula conservatrix]|uniref:hypothetical protein n=1 Tax=Desulforegula conservatrix TaxID=153026 RepID=UPI0004887210|nr:hypothetical protein [Desulforegula conservatrix]